MEFAEMIRRIVDAGATPFVICKCGANFYMIEGNISTSKRMMTEPCRKCGTTEEKKLLADFDDNYEDLL